MTERQGATFTFVHAADLHLDTPFTGVHELAPFVARELREASLDAFDAIVDLALERQAAFVVIAGDVYDGAERGLRAQLRFAKGLELLAREGISTFVVHGNHDPLKIGWSAISSWPKEVKIFGSEAVEVVPIVRDGETIATVQGISYATPATEENLALRFRRPEGPGLHVGLLHCNVGSDKEHGDYSPCSLDDLRQTRLDYFALGHIHSRRTLAEGTGPGDPWIVYPGNTQARSPKPSERGPKGALVVRVERGQVDEVEFVACDRVRFDEIECDISDASDTADLADQLIEHGRGRLDLADGRSLILRARITGRGPLHADLARLGSVEELLKELRSSQGERPPFLWWDEISDESRPTLDFEEIRRRGDFASDLIAVADEVRGDSDSRQVLGSRLADEAPRALQRAVGELVIDDEFLESILEDAVTVAVDSVLGDQL